MLYGIAGISAVFAFIEYIQHKEFNDKHPYYEKCHSGVLGFVILSVVLLITAIR